MNKVLQQQKADKKHPSKKLLDKKEECPAASK